MATKVVADPDARTITLTEAPTNGLVSVNAIEDIYSALKNDWQTDSALQKIRFPFEPVGGDTISPTEIVGRYVFVRNQDGWRIQPFDADHELKVVGNFFPRDPDRPLWLSRAGRTIVIQTERSSLATSVQQEALEFSSYSGAVAVDPTSSFAGTLFPVGTLQAPVNNLSDALQIANSRGFSTLRVLSDITLDGDLSGLEVGAVGARDHIIVTVDAAATVADTRFNQVKVKGTVNGLAQFKGCILADGLSMAGDFIRDCFLEGSIIFTGSDQVLLINCVDIDPTVNTPSLDLASFTGVFSVRGYTGGLHIINKVTPDTVAVGFDTGRLIVDSSDTAGTIRVRGVGKVEGTTGGTSIVQNELIARDDLGSAVRNELSVEMGRIDTSVSSRSSHSAADAADAVRTDQSVELGRIDDSISSRAVPGDQMALTSAERSQISDVVLQEVLSDHSSVAGSLAEAMEITKGLSQDNFFLDNTTYSAEGVLLGGRIRIFPNSSAVSSATVGGSGEGELHVFTVEASTKSGEPSLVESYKVFKQ